MALISSIFEDTLNPVFSNIFGVDGDAPIFNPASIAGLYFSSALSTGNVLFSSVGTDPRELQQGYAIDLNGTNQYGDLSDHIAAFASKTRGRITGYIKTTTTAISQIIGASDKSDGSSDIAVRLTADGKLQFVVRDNAVPDILWDSTATVNDGVEHSFDVHMTATGLVVKIDGAVDAGTFTNGNASTVAWFNDVADLDFLAIGANEDSGGLQFYYDGAAFGLVIYDEDGTTELLNIPTIEKLGATAYDVSGNGYHATWVNSPAYVVQNVFSYANTVGHSEYMYFDGVDDYVRLDDVITMPGDFKVSWIQYLESGSDKVVVGGGTDNFIRWDSTGLLVRINGTIFTFDTEPTYQQALNYSVRRVGSNLTLARGGVDVETISGNTDDFLLLEIGTRFSGVLLGMFFGVIANLSVDVGNTGASNHEWLGYGNTNDAWLDQIGSNNGTVVGSPSNILIPALTDLTADASGGTLQHQGVAKPRAYADGNSCIDLNGSSQSGDAGDLGKTSGTYGSTEYEFDIYIKEFSVGFIFSKSRLNESLEAHINTNGRVRFIPKEDLFYDVPSDTFSINTWHKVAFSWDSSTGLSTCIVDGDSITLIKAGAGSTTSTGTYDGETFKVGRREGGTPYFANCRLANLNLTVDGEKLLNTPISEGAGTTSYDKSGNNNDITWVNAPTWSTQDVFAANFEHGFSLYEHATLDPIRVPYGENGSPLTITPPSGYTKTSDNPPIKGHNDFEGTLDFVNTSIDRQPVPETARIDAITTADISAFTFGMSIASDDNVFYRDLDSVTNDRLTIYEADLTGAGLAKLLKYTNDGGK